MRAGLAASMLTPGSTAPDVSFTRPAMAPVWATAADGRNATDANATTQARRRVRMTQYLLVSTVAAYCDERLCGRVWSQVRIVVNRFWPRVSGRDRMDALTQSQ